MTTNKSDYFDIHEFDKKLNQARRRLEKANISNHNKDRIREYMKYVSFKRGKDDKSTRTAFQEKVLCKLIRFFELFIDQDIEYYFDNEEAIKSIKKKINSRHTATDKPWKISTKVEYGKQFKRFFRWAKQGEFYYKKDEPKEIYCIKSYVSKDDEKKITPQDIIEQKDIILAIKKESNIRNKALLACIYETAARVGDVCGATIGHCKKTADGYLISMRNKGSNGTEKTLLVFELAAYLDQWLQNHPDKFNKLAPLFCLIDGKKAGKPMRYADIRKAIRVSLSRSVSVDLDKHPHILRHSRISHMAIDLGMNEYELKAQAGWSAASEMINRYTHISSDLANRKRLEKAGKLKKAEESNFKECQFCYATNPMDNMFCYKCHNVLSLKDALDIQLKRKEKDNMILDAVLFLKEKHPEVGKDFAKFLIDKGFMDT